MFLSNWLQKSQDWLPIQELKVLVRFLIADITVLSVFRITTLYSGFLFRSYHEIIHTIEMRGLYCLMSAALMLLILRIAQIGWKGLWNARNGIVFA